MLNKSENAKGPQPPQSCADLLASRLCVPEHVVYRAFPAETVILNLNSGRYHGVNPTGGRMLELLDQLASGREVAARLAREYGRAVSELERDVCDFASHLLSRGLIELDEEDSPGSSPGGPAAASDSASDPPNRV